MKVILKQDIKGLGQAGAIVFVAEGFARNYLIPRKFAIPATPMKIKAFEHEKRIFEARQNKLRKEAEALKNKLERVSCSIAKKVTEGDRLYGSVTVADIEAALQNEGYKIESDKIVLDEPIKTLGVYTIQIKLFDDIVANTKVWIVRE